MKPIPAMMTKTRPAMIHVRGVCGVDEAGRGPLAGPVVAAAVILDPARPVEGLRDSKKLSAARRDALSITIRAQARAWAVAEASVDEIERLNILHATMLAMQRAVAALSEAPQRIRIDGNRAPLFEGLCCPVETLIGGDDLDASIAAASILAKTARDALALDWERAHPGYGFAAHKGYGTAAHLEALSRLGPCVLHRRGFAPVRQLSLFDL